MRASLQTLLAPGVLGVFTAYEATEIFAQPPSGPAVNLLTLIVAVETAPPADADGLFLNPRPIRLKSLHGWSFGVQRYQRPIGGLAAALATLEASATWIPSGSPSHTGALRVIDPVFVAPDSTEIAPLNRVLKNNFWNGGYVLEWADPAKTTLKPLLEDPRRLAELAQAIVALTPIRLADLSDRLGHVIVQVPVTILMTRFGQARGGEPTVEVAWHPAATPRPLRAAALMDHDGALTVAASVNVQPGENTLPAGGRGLLRAWLWDQTHQLVLAATAPTAFLRSIAFNLQLSSPEPRTFSYSRADGSFEDLRVGLQGTGSVLSV